MGTEAEKKKKQRRNTLILLVILGALLSLLYMLRLKTLHGRDGQGGSEVWMAVIQVDGETIHTMKLDEDAEYRVEIPEEHYNEVAVRDGWVQVLAADCGNQVCVKTGRIRNPGEVIACLPHRLIITIEDEAAQGDK